MVKTLPKHAENENEKMVPAPTAAWLQHGSTGPIFHGQHRTEVEQLLGDPTKAKTLLGWNPRKTSFEELVKIMVTHDMAFVKKLYMRAQMNGKNTSQTC